MTNKNYKIIMSEDEAKQLISSFEDCLGILDFDEIFGKKEDDEANMLKEHLIKGVRLGLIKFDVQKQEVIQSLVSPIKQKEGNEVKELVYKNTVTLNRMHQIDDKSSSKAVQDLITSTTGLSAATIGKLRGQDFLFARGCSDFFTK
jgi:hypothetical protein